MVGVWETGEGERVPPPRQPLPPWRYPHGPAHGEIPEKNRARLPIGSTPDTISRRLHPGYGCSPDIATHCPRPPGGGGGGAPQVRAGRGPPAEAHGHLPTEARPGRGRPAEVHGHLPTEARPGRGCRRGIRVSPAEGAAGAGVPARYPGIPCRRRGRGGGTGRSVWVSPCRRRGWDAGEERIGFPPSGMPAENVAREGNVSAFRASLCPRHLFLPVSRHNLPGIEDRSV